MAHTSLGGRRAWSSTCLATDSSALPLGCAYSASTASVCGSVSATVFPICGCTSLPYSAARPSERRCCEDASVRVADAGEEPPLVRLQREQFVVPTGRGEKVDTVLDHQQL